MNAATKRGRLALRAATAAELMTPNPVCIPEGASFKEAIQLLMDRRISAAPVVNAKGRAVGVVSRSDIVEHDRGAVDYARQAPEYYTRRDLTRVAGEDLPGGFQVERVDRTRVCDVMTPAIFSVRPNASVEEVIRFLIDLDIHRLFILDGEGAPVGVISMTDVVRNLLP